VTMEHFLPGTSGKRRGKECDYPFFYFFGKEKKPTFERSTRSPNEMWLKKEGREGEGQAVAGRGKGGGGPGAVPLEVVAQHDGCSAYRIEERKGKKLDLTDGERVALNLASPRWPREGRDALWKLGEGGFE